MVTNSYRPGVHKLIRHLNHLQRIRSGECVAPIHVSIWPTIRCQSHCSYCCCRNEDHSKEDLLWKHFTAAIDILSAYGTKALEFSGGGEPLLWPFFNKGVIYAKEHGLKLSLITNGLALTDIPKEILAKFEWIRISLQSVQHAKQIAFYYVPSNVRLSASYIVGNRPLKALHQIMKEKGIVTRIAVPQPSNQRLMEATASEVLRLGEPFFFAEKATGTPPGCYMAWIRAAIDWRGYFLPCPAVMLSPEADGRILEQFRLCHVLNLDEWIQTNHPRDLRFRCSFCNCGKEHNGLIHSLLNGVQDADFV